MKVKCIYPWGALTEGEIYEPEKRENAMILDIIGHSRDCFQLF